MGWGIWNNERWGDASSEENGMKSEARSGFDSEFVCQTFDDNFLAARATRLCAPTASARFRCGCGRPNRPHTGSGRFLHRAS